MHAFVWSLLYYSVCTFKQVSNCLLISWCLVTQCTFLCFISAVSSSARVDITCFPYDLCYGCVPTLQQWPPITALLAAASGDSTVSAWERSSIGGRWRVKLLHRFLQASFHYFRVFPLAVDLLLAWISVSSWTMQASNVSIMWVDSLGWQIVGNF